MLLQTWASPLGISSAELENRIRQYTYEWMPNQFNHEAGASNAYYDAVQKHVEPPQTEDSIPDH